MARQTAALLLAAMAAAQAMAGAAQRSTFGTLPDGVRIEAVTLTNGHGVRARIITYGATLQALEAPDRNGHSADVLLGYDDVLGGMQGGGKLRGDLYLRRHDVRP